MLRILLLASLLTLPARAADLPKVVVLELTTDAANRDAARFINESILTELSRAERYEVLGSSDVAALLGFERQKELLGCVEKSNCLAELGGGLGAQFLVTGSLGNLGNVARLDLKLIDATKGKVLARDGATVTESNLADESKRIIRTLLKGLSKAADQLKLANPKRAQASSTAAPPSEPQVASDATAELSTQGAPGRSVLWPATATVGGGLVAAGGAYLVVGALSFNERIGELAFSDAAKKRAAAQGSLTTGYVLTGVGILGAAAGAYWWASLPKDEDVDLSVLPTEGGAQVWLRARFGSGP